MNSDRSKNPGLDELIRRNVDAITRIEEAAQKSRTRSDVIAGAVAGFCGSIAFVYVHCVLFFGWLVWNGSGLVSKSLRFDPVPFNMLTLVVSLEAIFLSTFILVSQNRQQRIADQRNHLDLQINMLAEQESSQMLAMMKKIMDHLEIPTDDDIDVALQQATDHERIAEHIQESLGDDSGTASPDKPDIEE